MVDLRQLPHISALYHPILVVIGMNARLRPYRPTAFSNDQLRLITKRADFNPEQLDLDSKRRWVHLACCMMGTGQERVLRMHPGPVDQWSLTPTGVVKLTTLLTPLVQVYKAAPKPETRSVNATSRYLDQRILATGGIRGTFMYILRQALSAKLPLSRSAGIIEDHLQMGICRLVQRDGLAQKIAAGVAISDRQIASFVVRSGYNDIRDSGRNPICRETMGARTEQELNKGHRLSANGDTYQVVWDIEEEGWQDIKDPAASPEDIAQFGQLWDQVESAIVKHKKKNSARYQQIMRQKAEGITIKELAEQEGVTPCRANAMLSEIQKIIDHSHLTLDG